MTGQTTRPSQKTRDSASEGGLFPLPFRDSNIHLLLPSSST
uniref:Uncharacterized protein n=1 Tax=Anguilla anguilla TaxID=7936 RepID=A0A0E9USZ5_ANGAN